MIFSKYFRVLAGLLCFSYATQAQEPSQKEVVDYLLSRIKVQYAADMNRDTLDVREVKVKLLDYATDNFLFGAKTNNKMDVTAVLLRDLFSSKNGDIKFQKTVYDGLKKLGRSMSLIFINDVAVKLDKKNLRKYTVYHYIINDRNYVWPASYVAASPIFIFGEYFSKNPTSAKEMLIELLNNLNGAGGFGAVSMKDRMPGPFGAAVTTRTDKDILRITADQQARWTLADTKQLGIIANDWDGPKEIGTAPAERKLVVAKGAGPQVLNFWFPNVRAQDKNQAWKRTLIGTMKDTAEHYENDDWFPDHDIDFYVTPDKDYQYLITENPKPNISFFSGAGNILNDHERPNCPPFHDHVEAEIDLKDVNEKQFLYFFNDQMKTAKSAGFFGTWMYDRGHCDHPEIHPAEQFWWTIRRDNVTTYRCNLVCDYSDRYNRKSQYDDDGGKYTIKTPWAAPPVKGTFAIAFTLKPGRDKLFYRIFMHDYYNLNVNKTVAFDNVRAHNFILNEKTVITVVEPEKKCLKVTFEQVAFDNAGNLTGFIVLTSAVGNGGKYIEPGHLFFEVKKTVIKSASAPAGKVKVSLESIECLKVGDGDDAEEIFGRIYCRAYATKDTSSYRERLNVKANVAATTLCNRDLETLFCATCPDWITFKTGQKNTYNTSFTYDFPADGYIEIVGDLDESDSRNCSPPEYLGQEQKTYVLTNEIGSTPYKFTQFFARGKTIIRANYSIQKIQ